MRRNPERAAWVVLLTSFAACCALTLAVPFGGRWWLQNAAAPQKISMASTGTVLVGRPGTGRTEANLVDIPVGSTVATQPDSQANLTFYSPDGGEVLASVQLYGNAEMIVDRADSPRYGTGIHPHHITLRLVYGRARAVIGLGVQRDIQMEIASAPNVVTWLEAPGSKASVEAGPAASNITVRDGEAVVTGDGQTVTLQRDQRAEAFGQGQLNGPLPAERNLILNGDFRDPLSTGWTADVGTPVDPAESTGTLGVVASTGQRAVNFTRTGSNWGRVGITQNINQDVRDFKSLRLHLAVLVVRQDLFNCGQVGTECPLMVLLLYIDAAGAEREWLQGFYYNFNADPSFGPTTCAPCRPPRSDHLRVAQNQWTVFDSGENLLDLFQQSGPAPVTIKSISLYASGHTFNSLVTEVQLLAAE